MDSSLWILHLVQLGRDFFGSLLKVLHLTLNLLPRSSLFVQLLLQLGDVGLSRELRIFAVWWGHLRNGIHFFFFIFKRLVHGIHSLQFFNCWLCAFNGFFFLLLCWLDCLFVLSEGISYLWVTESSFSKNTGMLAILLWIDLGNSTLLRHLWKYRFLTSSSIFWSCLNYFIKSCILNFILFKFLFGVRSNVFVS